MASHVLINLIEQTIKITFPQLSPPEVIRISGNSPDNIFFFQLLFNNFLVNMFITIIIKLWINIKNSVNLKLFFICLWKIQKKYFFRWKIFFFVTGQNFWDVGDIKVFYSSYIMLDLLCCLCLTFYAVYVIVYAKTSLLFVYAWISLPMLSILHYYIH